MRTPKYELENRIKSLRKVMEDLKIDVFISGAGAQIDQRGILRYFLDYYVPVFEEYVVIPLSGPVTFLPHDYAGANYAATSPVIEDIITVPTGAIPSKIVGEAVKKFNPKIVGAANLSGLSFKFFNQLKEELSMYEIVDMDDKISKIRAIKSNFEIKQTIETVKLNEDSFHAFLKEVKAGVYDRDAVQRARAATDLMGAEDQYWMLGTQGPAGFWIAANEQPTLWQEKDLIVGVTEHAGEGGHWGEVANLISIGEPENDIIKAQKALATAQKEAFKTIKPGVSIGKMADKAEEVLEQLGYSESSDSKGAARYHGHSQGMDVFEPPVIVSGGLDLMEEGMRLNFHPSAFLADGRKISYCVCYLVTSEGGKRLTNLSDEIYIV